MAGGRRVGEAMNWLRRLGRNRLLDFGAAVIAVLCVVRLALVLPSRATENDFAHYYVARQLLFDAPNPYTTPLAPLYAQHGLVSEKTLPYATDPPTMLWLFAPLEWLPLRMAFGLWVGAEIASLSATLWLTRRLLEGRLSARGWWFLCAGTVASTAVYWHFCYSQLQLSIAAILLAAYAYQRTGKDSAACLLVTAAGLLKLFPFVLLPWFLWRSKGSAKTRAGRTALMIAVVAVCIWLTGWSRWVDFSRDAMTTITESATRYLDSYSIGSLVGKFGSRMKIASPFLGPMLMALGYWRCSRFHGDPEAEFCLMTVAMVAGGVVAWAHYFVLLIFPMAVAATRIATDVSGWRVMFYTLLWLCFENLHTYDTVFLKRHLYLRVWVNYLPLYGLVAFLLFFAMVGRGTRQPTAR